MRLRFVVPLLVFAGLLQTVLLPHTLLLNVKPDLILLLVVTWGTIRGSQEGILWGLIGGIVLDLLGAAPFGTATMAIIVVAFLTSVGEFNLVRSSLFLPLILIFGGTLVYNAIFLLILQATGSVVYWGDTFNRVMLPASVVNTFCTPPVYIFLRWLSEQIKPVKVFD